MAARALTVPEHACRKTFVFVHCHDNQKHNLPEALHVASTLNFRESETWRATYGTADTVPSSAQHTYVTPSVVYQQTLVTLVVVACGFQMTSTYMGVAMTLNIAPSPNRQ